MRITTPILVSVFTAACGSRSPAPAPGPEAGLAPANVATGGSAADATPAVSTVDVHARCAELGRPSNEAREAARVLATTTTDVTAAVTCLADALDRSAGPQVGGTEQQIEQESLRNELAAAIQSLTGMTTGYDLAVAADLRALAVAARDWVAHH